MLCVIRKETTLSWASVSLFRLFGPCLFFGPDLKYFGKLNQTQCIVYFQKRGFKGL